MDWCAQVLPVDASTEDIDIDPALSFLDTFVQNALANGAKPYNAASKRCADDDDLAVATDGLKWEAYDQPADPDSAAASQKKKFRTRAQKPAFL